MLKVTHDTWTVQALVDLHARRRLNLSPGFQRQSVWNLTDRRLLIRSLIDGVPIPSLYLYRAVGHGGSPVYEVIDGKQRLETILLFLGKGPLSATIGDLAVKTDIDDEYRSWTWRALDRARRNALLTTKIPVIEVEGEMSQIIDLFVRINSTGKRLEGQERRHAQFYDNPVLKAANALASKHLGYLTSHKVLTPPQVQRMRHVELMAELLLTVSAGVPLNKKKKLDQVIAGNAIDAAALRDASAAVTRALGLVNAVLPQLHTTRFRHVADFYTLAFLLHSFKEEGRTITAHGSARNALAGQLLTQFGLSVDEVSDATRTGHGASQQQEPFRQYLMTVREGTDSAAQRRDREKLLRAVLDGVFDDLDTARTFNAVQRRILWHASSQRRCTLCGKPIVSWEHLAIDHVEPYIKGGKTRLRNAALAHRKCNSAAGAKWGDFPAA